MSLVLGILNKNLQFVAADGCWRAVDEEVETQSTAGFGGGDRWKGKAGAPNSHWFIPCNWRLKGKKVTRSASSATKKSF